MKRIHRTSSDSSSYHITGHIILRADVVDRSRSVTDFRGFCGHLLENEQNVFFVDHTVYNFTK